MCPSYCSSGAGSPWYPLSQLYNCALVYEPSHNMGVTLLLIQCRAVQSLSVTSTLSSMPISRWTSSWSPLMRRPALVSPQALYPWSRLVIGLPALSAWRKKAMKGGAAPARQVVAVEHLRLGGSFWTACVRFSCENARDTQNKKSNTNKN